MTERKTIFAIVGSASKNSSNLMLVKRFAALTQDVFDVTIFDRLQEFPHFSPERSASDTPEAIVSFREKVSGADGVLICTPEYVFSIPSGLKNAIEWCVATTVFSEKPVGIITASAHGVKGHEELQLIMKTLYARVSEETSLLIQGVKGKIDERGEIRDAKTHEALEQFIGAYKMMVSQGLT